MHCSYCGQEHPDSARFCPVTGKTLVPEQAICPRCGRGVQAEATYCPTCGADLRAVSNEIYPASDRSSPLASCHHSLAGTSSCFLRYLDSLPRNTARSYKSLALLTAPTTSVSTALLRHPINRESAQQSEQAQSHSLTREKSSGSER